MPYHGNTFTSFKANDNTPGIQPQDKQSFNVIKEMRKEIGMQSPNKPRRLNRNSDLGWKDKYGIIKFS